MKECISIQSIGVANIFHSNKSVIYLQKIIIDNDGGDLAKLRKLRICNTLNLCACYVSICVICNIFACFGRALRKAVYINITDDEKLFKQLNYFSPPILLLFFVRSGLSFDLGALSQTGGAVGAQLALTGPQSQTGSAAQVDEVVHIQLAQGIFDFARGDHFALADEGVGLGVVTEEGDTPLAVAVLGRAFDRHREAGSGDLFRIP